MYSMFDPQKDRVPTQHTVGHTFRQFPQQNGLCFDIQPEKWKSGHKYQFDDQRQNSSELCNVLKTITIHSHSTWVQDKKLLTAGMEQWRHGIGISKSGGTIMQQAYNSDISFFVVFRIYDHVVITTL